VRPRVLREGTVVFDPNLKQHHGLFDEETGRIYDVPWNASRVSGAGSLEEFEVREYHVVMKGRVRKTERKTRLA